MRSRPSAAVRLVVAALVVTAGASRAVATVLVPMPDAALVDSSQLVAFGAVRRVESHLTADGRIVTDATFALERVMKGQVEAGEVVVRVPGGGVGGVVAHVSGAPSFVPGGRFVLFLKRTADGGYRTNALALGAYRVVTAPGGELVARRRDPSPDARRLGAFCTRVEELAAGVPEGDATPDATAEPLTAEEYTFMAGPSRWFTQPVTLGLANGASDLSPNDSVKVVQDGMRAWTDIASASLDLRMGIAAGTARSIAGGVCDGVSVIQFDDPFGEVQDMVGCGGVLAIGGFCGNGSTTTVDGTVFRGIREADITMNARLGSCFGVSNVSEVMTHELGHAVGIGHSADRDATMYPTAHFDGRGAAVRADDAAGVSALYPLTGVTTTTSTLRPTTTTSSTTSTTVRPTTSTSRSTTTTLRTTTTTSRSTSTTLRPTTTTSSSTTSTARSTTSTSRTTSSTRRPTTTTSTTIPPTDDDGDGVVGPLDACPDTPAQDIVFVNGCSVCPCAADAGGVPWASRAAYVRCVREAIRVSKLTRGMTLTDARDALRHARSSTCGRADLTRCCIATSTGTRCRIAPAVWCGLPATDLGSGSCRPNPCPGAPVR